MGVPAVRMQVDGSVFDVRVRGQRAEAIRRNPEWPPRRAVIMPRAAAAIAGVSGCQVARLRGDVAVIRADLDCGGGAPPRPPAARAYDCEVVALDNGHGELYCEPPL